VDKSELAKMVKVARKDILRTGVAACVVILAGCQQQQVKPPTTDIPQVPTEQPTEATEPTPDTASDQAILSAELPTQTTSQWERDGREIARTELPSSTNTTETPSPIASEDSATGASDTSTPLELARLEIETDQPETAIEIIQRTDPRQLDRNERADMLQVKAEALRRLNLTIAALRTEAKRLEWIDPDEQDAEMQRLFAEIEQLPPLLVGDLGSGSDQLAGLAAAYRLQGTTDRQRIERWMRRFSNHPLSNSSLPDYAFLTDVEVPTQFHVTVLLPLSGDLEKAGRAIRDGILFALAAHPKRDALTFEFIDTTRLAEAELETIRSGQHTEFVIGPLRKSEVARFLAQPSQVPALVLNRIDETVAKRPGGAPIYSLSLAIEDDARSAVAYAARMADTPQVLMFNRPDALGQRAAAAVESALADSDGILVDQFTLDDENAEDTIADALGVTDSRNRRRELTRLLGLALEHTPRIRDDVTAVVLQTDPDQARQLRPLLDFYYLSETPVILTGAFRPDLNEMTEDFTNSLILATPWELGSQAREQLVARPFTQSAFGTLTAIGKDALDMTIRLGFGEATEFQGETGYLSLGDRLVIERRLGQVMIDADEQISERLWDPDRSASIRDSEDPDA
jgi:outer membrane PBP1 activator LpoA protein